MLQSQKIYSQGRAKTYNDWIQGVFELSKKDEKDLTVTPNIKDVAVGQNLAAKEFDPYMQWLPYFVALILMIQITFAMKEKMRLIFLLQDLSYYDVKRTSRKIKIQILALYLCVRLVLLAIIVEAACIFILLASNTIELLNNVLSVLVLDTIDNMGALVAFNALRTNFNELTTQDNFMLAKSSQGIENFLFPVYFISIVVAVIKFVELRTYESYNEFVSGMPKVENGRFDERPTFARVGYVGAIILVLMNVAFACYVLYKRSVLKKRVLAKFSKTVNPFGPPTAQSNTQSQDNKGDNSYAMFYDQNQGQPNTENAIR